MKQSLLIIVLSVLCMQTAWAQQVAREDTLSMQDYEMNEVVIQTFKQHQDLKVYTLYRKVLPQPFTTPPFTGKKSPSTFLKS